MAGHSCSPTLTRATSIMSKPSVDCSIILISIIQTSSVPWCFITSIVCEKYKQHAHGVLGTRTCAAVCWIVELEALVWTQIWHVLSQVGIVLIVLLVILSAIQSSSCFPIGHHNDQVQGGLTSGRFFMNDQMLLGTDHGELMQINMERDEVVGVWRCHPNAGALSDIVTNEQSSLAFLHRKPLILTGTTR